MKTLNFFVILTFLLSIISCNKNEKPVELSLKNISSAEKLIGLELTKAEKDSMLEGLQDAIKDYNSIHNYPISNDIPPAYLFNPLPYGFTPEKEQNNIHWNITEKVELPANIDELAFYTLAELSGLIRQKKISSLQLTQFYLERLKKFGDTLQCVITLTEDLALKQARRADEEISQ